MVKRKKMKIGCAKHKKDNIVFNHPVEVELACDSKLAVIKCEEIGVNSFGENLEDAWEKFVESLIEKWFAHEDKFMEVFERFEEV